MIVETTRAGMGDSQRTEIALARAAQKAQALRSLLLAKRAESNAWLMKIGRGNQGEARLTGQATLLSS